MSLSDELSRWVDEAQVQTHADAPTVDYLARSLDWSPTAWFRPKQVNRSVLQGGELRALPSFDIDERGRVISEFVLEADEGWQRAA